MRRSSLFLNNRYHDPTLGTFISVDPLVQATGEPYIYASGNPTTLSDPTGLCPTDTAAAAACYAALYNAMFASSNDGAPPSGQDVHSTTRQKAYNVAAVPKCGISACREPSPPRPTDDSEWVCGPAGQRSSSGCDWFEPLDEDSGLGLVVGACGDGGVSGGLYAGAALCMVYDDDEMALIAVYGLGGGAGASPGGEAGSAGITGGALTTNASDFRELLGYSVCGGGSGGKGHMVSGEVCLGLSGISGNRTGIWSAYAGYGIGAGAEGHVYEVHARQVFVLPNVSCIAAVDPVGSVIRALSC